METIAEARRRPRASVARAIGVVIALFLAVAAGDTVPAHGQEGGQQEGGQQIEREEPLARVGVTKEFSATLDSAPRSADWKLLRKTLALRYEPGKNDQLEQGTRKHLVLHAAVIEKGEVQGRHTSDPVELLPGATKLEPDAYLPEASMVPEGYRISSIMSLGEIQVQPGEIMTELVRDIVGDMTKNAPALYLAPAPPEENLDGPHKIHPVLVQLTPSKGAAEPGG